MREIYFAKEKIASLNHKNFKDFLAYCNEFEITYVYKNQEDLYLYPPLHDVPIIICPIEENQLINSFISSLQETLTREGALVIKQHKKLQPALLKIMHVRIALSFTEKKLTTQSNHLKFYYSFKNKDQCLPLINNIIHKLNEHKLSLSYSLANLCNYFNPKYWQLFFTDVPTVLLELNNLKTPAEENILTTISQVITENIVTMYGRKPTAINLEKINSLLNKIEEKPDEDFIDNAPILVAEKTSLFPSSETHTLEGIDDPSSWKEENNLSKNTLKKPKKLTLVPPGEGPTYYFSRKAQNSLSVNTQGLNLNTDSLPFTKYTEIPRYEEENERIYSNFYANNPASNQRPKIILTEERQQSELLEASLQKNTEKAIGIKFKDLTESIESIN